MRTVASAPEGERVSMMAKSTNVQNGLALS